MVYMARGFSYLVNRVKYLAIVPTLHLNKMNCLLVINIYLILADYLVIVKRVTNQFFVMFVISKMQTEKSDIFEEQ